MVKENIIENVLLVTLALLSISLFFSQSGISIFGPLSLLLLIIWRYVFKYKPAKHLPGYLVLVVMVFMLNVFLGGIMSDNHAKGLSELKKYWNVFLCALLFTCAMSDINRKRLIIVFFFAASMAGLVGIFQNFGIFFEKWEGWRAHGFMHPIHYAGILAFACATSLMLLLIPNNIFFSFKTRLFLVVSALLSFAGILFSQTRGVWLALFASCLIVFFIYNYKKAVVGLVLMTLLSVSIFASSDTLKQRAQSIVNSARNFYSEDKSIMKPERYDIWKGALLIFKDSPVFGTGTGDFEDDMNRLIDEEKIRGGIKRQHAHSIYFQWLSTQGMVGLISLLLLLASLTHWGMGEIKRGSTGGYVIILAVFLMATGGLTENNIGISKYFSAWCFTMGLFGGGSLSMSREKSILK
jgi:O-antigen ligase